MASQQKKIEFVLQILLKKIIRGMCPIVIGCRPTTKRKQMLESCVDLTSQAGGAIGLI